MTNYSDLNFIFKFFFVTKLLDLSCNECSAIIKVPENNNLTAIKRHAKTHKTKIKETKKTKLSNPKKKITSSPERIEISSDELIIFKAKNIKGMSDLIINNIGTVPSRNCTHRGKGGGGIFFIVPTEGSNPAGPYPFGVLPS